MARDNERAVNADRGTMIVMTQWNGVACQVNNSDDENVPSGFPGMACESLGEGILRVELAVSLDVLEMAVAAMLMT